MKRYSLERKDAAIQKMMPPINTPISTLAVEVGITEATLYNWRKQAKSRGSVVPGDGENAENGSSSDKFSVVLQTAALNEIELAQYCRTKGLHAEQIALWRQACMGANAAAAEQEKIFTAQAMQDKKHIKRLETDLRRKEKALAETAALLVLRSCS